jgi:hypothetical protein
MNVQAVNAMLVGLLARIGTAGAMKFFSGTKPVEGGGETTRLATVVLAETAGVVDSGRVTLTPRDAFVLAEATGVPTWGRLETTDGMWVWDFTVSGQSGSGQVKVTVVDPTPGDPEGKLYQGGKFFLTRANLGE